MKTKIKRMLGVLLAVVILLGIVGCSNTESSSQASSGEQGQSSSQDQQNSAPEEIEITLNTWRTDINQLFSEPEYYPQDLADKGIKVTCTFIASDKYEEQMKADWNAGMAADVMTIQMGSQYLESIPYLQELTPLIDASFNDPDWKTKYFKDGAFAGIDDLADGTYCLPIGIGVQYFMLCNQDKFDQFGLEIPTTYDELKAVSEVFRQNDLVPVSWGFKEPDQSVTLLRCIISDFDPDCWYGLEYTGEASFTDEIPTTAVNIMKEMLDTGILNENFVASTPSDAQDGFYQGNAAMTINGGWMLGTYTDDKYEEWIKNMNIVLSPLPDFNGDGKPTPVVAGPNVAFSIPTTTPEEKQSAAFEVVRSCTTGDGAKFLLDCLQILPSTLKDYEPKIESLLSEHEIDEVKSHLETMDEYISTSLPPYRIFNPIVKSETFVALGEILSNQTDVDSALAALEENVKDSREQYNYFK